MPTIFYDTNVLMDVLNQRPPHAGASGEAWSLVDNGQVDGWVAAITFNNVEYILRKQSGDRRQACQGVQRIFDSFKVVPVDRAIIAQALGSGFRDFEDAIQHACAASISAEMLVTRNQKHFPPTPIRIASPEELLQQFPLNP